MDTLLKRVADLTLIFVALLSLINFLPIEIKGTNLLIVSGLILFILFIALITHHVSKLQEKIDKTEEKFIRVNELIDIKKDIEAFKLLKLIKK